MSQQDQDNSNGLGWKGYLLLTIVGLVILSIVVVSVAAYFFPSVIGGWFAQRQAAEDAVQSTYSWENARESYEFFKRQKEEIERNREQLENYREQRERFLETHGNDSSEWSRQQEIRYGRIDDRIVAVQNEHEDLVAEYNARANMAHESIFRCGLPYEMDEKFWIGDGRPNDKYEEGAREAVPEEATECTELVEAAQGAP